MQEDYLSHMKLETEGREIARFFRTDERNLKATKGFFFFLPCVRLSRAVYHSLIGRVCCGSIFVVLFYNNVSWT
jgi:hypothetical protein